MPIDTPETRPPHYGGESNPFEPIKIIEHYGLNFSLGSALKYILRHGRKAGEDAPKDLHKGAWYLTREAKRLEKIQKAQGEAADVKKFEEDLQKKAETLSKELRRGKYVQSVATFGVDPKTVPIGYQGTITRDPYPDAGMMSGIAVGVRFDAVGPVDDLEIDCDITLLESATRPIVWPAARAIRFFHNGDKAKFLEEFRVNLTITIPAGTVLDVMDVDHTPGKEAVKVNYEGGLLWAPVGVVDKIDPWVHAPEAVRGMDKIKVGEEVEALKDVTYGGVVVTTTGLTYLVHGVNDARVKIGAGSDRKALMWVEKEVFKRVRRD